MGDVVLVHGGWHGGWIWDRLVPLLAIGGHRVHAPTLTGLGERAAECTPDVTLRTHVDDVVGVVGSLGPAPVTLVGHSYGGSLITAVADAMPDRIEALIYLDAVVPTNGVPDWLGFPRERRDAMRAASEALDGYRVPPPDPCIWGLEPGSPAHVHIGQRLTPHPIRTMLDAPCLTGHWAQVTRKFYWLAADTRTARFVALHAALSATPGWSTAVVPGGHEMMWTHPAALAEAILSCLAAAR